MCLKVVIKDQVKNTKFAQENTCSTCTSIVAQYLLIHRETYCLFDRSLILYIEIHGPAKISNAKKAITYLFEAQTEIRLNWHLKDIISQLLEGFLERETLCLYN